MKTSKLPFSVSSFKLQAANPRDMLSLNVYVNVGGSSVVWG